MSRSLFILIFFLFPAMLGAQSIGPSLALDSPPVLSFSSISATPMAPSASVPVLEPSVTPARMSPDLALATYHKQSSQQSRLLMGYSAATMIRAELPASSQHGQFELERRYTAPRSLAFKPVHYEGDGFVRTNVIARILQSEVDHVQKDDPAATALRAENYKFSHKGYSQIEGRPVHVFQVKPRKKHVGLFKGQIYLDAYTGSLVRVEGRVVKSPSLFVKKIDFVQDYSDINGFTFPVRMHSEAKAALVGRTLIDIEIRDYQPIATPLQSQAVSGSY